MTVFPEEMDSSQKNLIKYAQFWLSPQLKQFAA